MKKLEGRVAVITGAASGIGRASADLFAQEGASVLAVDRPDAAAPPERPGVVALRCDLSRDEAAQEIVQAALNAFGAIDILFNNAGVAASRSISETTDDLWDHVNDVNLKAVFRLVRAAIPSLEASAAGRIINTASVMAEGTDYGLAAYCASKAGVVGLTRTAALELGRRGITANAILPGAIHTGMTAASFQDPDIAAVWAKKSPLKRLGQPIDVARLALFLASDDSGFITGQAIAVDGGMRLRL